MVHIGLGETLVCRSSDPLGYRISAFFDRSWYFGGRVAELVPNTETGEVVFREGDLGYLPAALVVASIAFSVLFHPAFALIGAVTWVMKMTLRAIYPLHTIRVPIPGEFHATDLTLIPDEAILTAIPIPENGWDYEETTDRL